MPSNIGWYSPRLVGRTAQSGEPNRDFDTVVNLIGYQTPDDIVPDLTRFS